MPGSTPASHRIAADPPARPAPRALQRARPEAAGRRLAMLLLVALLARLGVWIWFDPLAPSIWDERDYDRLATSLAERGELAIEPGRPSTRRPPLYPALVAVVYAVAGTHAYQAVRLVQVLLDVALAAVVFALGRRLWDARTGLWAAALAAFYPSLWGHDYLLLTEVLFTFLLTLGALALVRYFDQERFWVLAAAGLVLGLATLTRSVLQVYPPVFAVLALVGLRRRPAARRWAAIAVFVASFSLPVAPWVVRNSLLQGRPTPVDTTAGRVLRPRLESLAPGQAGERQRLGRPGPLAGLAAIPAQALLFWRVDRELVAAAARGWLGPLPGSMVVALGVVIGGYYAALLLAGLCGAILQPPRSIHLAVVLSFVIAICGAHALTFGHSRYHIPLMPLVALFAARLVVAGPGRPARRRIAAAAGGALLLLGSWTLNLVREDLPELRQGLEGSLWVPRYHARE